jgi:hypothetical protein
MEPPVFDGNWSSPQLVTTIANTDGAPPHRWMPPQ